MESDDSPYTPCPVCGIPGQVCTCSAPPPHHIIGATLFPSLGHEDVYIVPDDVYEDREILNNAGIPTVTRVQIARKGDALRMSDARRLGLLTS